MSGAGLASGDLLLAAGACALCVAAALDPATIADGPVLCPFRIATGLPCPGCGTTRAWVYLVHGDAGSALAANPFGALAAVALALVLAWRVASLALPRAVAVPDLTRLLWNRPTQLLLAAWVTWGVARLVAVAIASTP